MHFQILLFHVRITSIGYKLSNAEFLNWIKICIRNMISFHIENSEYLHTCMACSAGHIGALW